MNHELDFPTITCPNCDSRMVPVKGTEQLVYVCLEQSCGWIAGPDLVVTNYLKSLEVTHGRI